MIKAEHINKQFSGGMVKKYHVNAVCDVSFEIHRGNILGIAGNSGCGKSTVARLLMGLIKPDGGTIFLDGEEITGCPAGQLRDRRKKMQIIFQHPESSLDPQKRILSSLLEPMKIHGIYQKKEEQIAAAEKLFELVGLTPGLFDRFPHQISGGEAQRIIIARALTLNPKVLILDEPTSMLDVSIQAHIMNLLKELQKEMDLTYLFISHDIEVLGWFCDEICVMHQGSIVEHGTKDEIMKQPRHAFTKELVDSFMNF